MSDPWWPARLRQPGVPGPAPEYGLASGGDYVRARPIYKTPAYLTPTVGNANTPDDPKFNITSGEIRLTARLSIPAIPAAAVTIAAQRGDTATNMAWQWNITQTGTIVFRRSLNGTAISTGTITGANMPIGTVEEIRVDYRISDGRTRAFRKAENGVWTQLGSNFSQGGGAIFNSTSRIAIGHRNSAGLSDIFTGTIYWVQMETVDTNGNPTDLLWRFDPNEWVSGTTYTSSRGKLWTLSAAGAITAGTTPVGMTTLPQTALRYPSSVTGVAEAIGKAYLTIRPFDYITAEVAWGWPVSIEERWSEVALVRSGMGEPLTVNDGQTVFRALKTDFDGLDAAGNAVTFPAPVVYDQPLQSGHWYYYTLFFRVGPLDWISGMAANVLIPRNHHHAEHLWSTVPPFYQFADGDPRSNGGGLHALERFLTVFGFELDQTREYVEQWQETYHIDKSPMPLLKRVGENFGYPYHGATGQISYRSYIAGLPEMLETRGTIQSLQFVIEATSKYQCGITVGNNLMLLPDDSDFFYGTGNWGGLHPTTDPLVSEVTTLPPTDINLTSNDLTVSPPADFGRGTMRVRTPKSVESQTFAIACGSGINQTREMVPLYTGVPVEVGSTYSFSIKGRHEDAANVQITPSLLWFRQGGQPSDYLAISDGVPVAVNNSAWFDLIIQGVAPAGAYFLVPVLEFGLRPIGGPAPWSFYVDLAGAAVHLLGEAGTAVVLAPDAFLTLGVTAEKLGDKQDPAAPGGFTEYILGTP